jgi:hypothetical protein
MGHLTNHFAEVQWNNLCREQGWNKDSKISQLENFLRKNGLFNKFLMCAEAQAEEENRPIENVAEFE